MARRSAKDTSADAGFSRIDTARVAKTSRVVHGRRQARAAVKTHRVAMLRGINVGRTGRIAMTDLQALLRSLGFTDVQTPLNGDNAIYHSPGSTAATDAIRIRLALGEKFQVDARVVVKTAQQINEIIADNPLAGLATDPARLLTVFVQQGSTLEPLAELARRDWEPDVLAVTDLAAYLWCGVGVLESRLAPLLLKPLGDTGTMRNWSTVLKIAEILHAVMSKKKLSAVMPRKR